MGLMRFMLALAVASGHAGGFIGTNIYPKVPGSHAVQIFYMISGFLIAPFVLRRHFLLIAALALVSDNLRFAAAPELRSHGTSVAA